ncbi:MAG: hypothetical protein ACMXYC_01575 [Candidatus Woesearchaeota archaeon]
MEYVHRFYRPNTEILSAFPSNKGVDELFNDLLTHHIELEHLNKYKFRFSPLGIFTSPKKVINKDSMLFQIEFLGDIDYDRLIATIATQASWEMYEKVFQATFNTNKQTMQQIRDVYQRSILEHILGPMFPCYALEHILEHSDN